MHSQNKNNFAAGTLMEKLKFYVCNGVTPYNHPHISIHKTICNMRIVFVNLFEYLKDIKLFLVQTFAS